MDFEFREGFCYTKYRIDHPLVEKFYSKYRFKLHPETVVRLCQDVPELRSRLDYDFYKKWAKNKGEAEAIKAARNFKFDYDFKMEPYAHQKKAIAFILHTPAQALFAEPGTGKTFCALVASEMRIKMGRVNKVLVICPASVMRTGWYNDLKKFTGLNGIVVHRNKWRWHCPICGTRQTNHKRAVRHLEKHGKLGERYTPDEELKWNDHKSVQDKLFNTDHEIYITSINMAHRYLEDFMAAGFDFVILDESTMIKTPDGPQGKSVHKLGHNSKYRLAMTGTPITNELEDIWTQMQFVDMPFVTTIGRFRNRYYWQHPVHHFIKKPKDDAGEQIAALTRDSVLRIRKSECLDLPPRTRSIREIEPSPAIKKVYKQFFADLYARHEDEEVVAYNTFTEILRLHQILNGYWTKVDSDEIVIIDEKPPKVREVERIMEQARNKVIIWTYYRRDANLLKSALKKYNPAVVNGATARVEDEVDKFLNDDSCRVMIAHPRSARFGHTWVVADTTIFYTYGYSVEDYWQARDRNHRIGQDKSIHEIFLSSGGIEGEIISALVKKEDFSKGVMENFTSMMRRFQL